MTARCIARSGAVRTRYGEIPAYPEGLYALGHDVYAWLVPNGSWGEANAGLVCGRDQSLLVDTLWDVPKTREMLDAMDPQTTVAPVATVVNTHADGDHFWGNQLVAAADIVTSDAARSEMAHHKPRSMRAFARLGQLMQVLPGRKNRCAGHYFQAMGAPYDFSSVNHTPARRGFSGSLELNIGGRKIALREVGPAHTSGDLIVEVPDAGVVFAGDILFIGSTPVMWWGPLQNWFDALDLVLDLDADVIVPGHGPLTNESGVRAVRAYWEFVQEAARDAYGAGTSAERAAFAIVRSEAFRTSPFAAWDSPERLMTNVHLLYREFAGRTGPLGTAEKILVLRRQASLAHALMGASPAAMRRA